MGESKTSFSIALICFYLTRWHKRHIFAKGIITSSLVAFKFEKGSFRNREESKLGNVPRQSCWICLLTASLYFKDAICWVTLIRMFVAYWLKYDLPATQVKKTSSAASTKVHLLNALALFKWKPWSQKTWGHTTVRRIAGPVKIVSKILCVYIHNHSNSLNKLMLGCKSARAVECIGLLLPICEQKNKKKAQCSNNSSHKSYILFQWNLCGIQAALWVVSNIHNTL